MKINNTYLLFLLLGILFLSLSMRRKCEGFTGLDFSHRRRTSARTPAPTPPPGARSSISGVGFG